MMHCGDAPTMQQRSSVFNLYVIPQMQTMEATLDRITDDKNHILFTYEFSKNNCKYYDLHTLEEIRTRFKEADETGVDHFNWFQRQLDMEKGDGKEYYYITVFHIGPKGGFHPSVYKYELTDRDWHGMESMGTVPESSPYNPWFSNKIIKSYLDWDKVASLDDLGEVEDGYIIVITIDKSMELEDTRSVCYYKFDTFMGACNRALVSKEMQKLIRNEYAKGKNLIIVDVINYLIDYFLLVRYNKNDQGTYDFEYISSPGDDSLSPSKVGIKKY